MKNEFIKYIKNNELFNRKNKLLLTVSGGIDSVVMLDLMISCGYDCAIAHCNFQLRGEDSNKDELLLVELKKKYNIPLFKIRFNTKEYAIDKKQSIQMAARELRYNWFEKIRNENNYDYIVIAHNQNDVVETFHINLLRGTGIKGITGIKSKVGKLVRPLLFADRLTIEKYQIENNLEYREDLSNKSVKYMRNKIRHQVLPVLKELNQKYNKTMVDNIARFKNVEEIFRASIIEKENLCVEKKNDTTTININKLKQLPAINTYLYEFLQPYEFSSDTCKDIICALDAESGLKFYSDKYRLIKDRQNLIINKINHDKPQYFKIPQNKDGIIRINKNVSLDIKTINQPKNFELIREAKTACLDLDLLTFPLIIRNWQNGDYFYPLGLNNKKKLSDFFIDNKMNINEKEEILILTSDDKIVWIVGKRIDNRYKVTDKTQNIIVITHQNNC